MSSMTASRTASLPRAAGRAPRRAAGRAPARRAAARCGAAAGAAASKPTLVLMRHGESFWNQRNLFTGCVDVPLTDNGINEALKAGKRIADVPVDVIYVSDLMRAQMTAMIAMTQHNRGKVPIVQHESPELSSKIFSEKTETDCIPVYKAWELNERMYGELQGLNKAETAEKYGDDQVKVWRRSYDIPPPDGESLEMTAERAVKYFKETIVPHLERGESVLVSAHGNSLRAIIMYIEKLSPDEVVLLELFTGIPLVYEMQEEGLKRMGTPQTDCAPGVYAISEGLAKYKDSLAALNDPLYSS